MIRSELDKMFKALEKSPTPSIALKRSKRLGTFIIQNTTEADVCVFPRTDFYSRKRLRELHLDVLKSVLSRFAV